MVQSVAADTGTWTGSATGTWDTSDTHWSGVSGTPWDSTNGPGNTATFNTASLAAAVSGPVFANGITFTTSGALSGSTINLAGTTPGISVATGQTGNISSTVAGTAGLIKTDAGLLTLSSATYTGGTTVTGGRLVLENTMTGSANFVTGSELEFNLTSGTQQINNGTFSGTGKLIKSGGNALLLGDFSGPQTVALTGANSVVDVQGGLLQVFYAFDNVPTNSWTGNEAGINVASGAVFDMRNGHVFADELTGTGTITKGGFDIGNNILTIGVKDGTGTFSGSLQDADWGANLTLVKQGTGTQTLNGATTYRGGTTVSGGRLVLVNTTTGGSNFVTNAELEFNVTSGNKQLNGGAISGTGKLIKTGAGELWLGASGSPQTVVLSSGSLIDVQGGVLRNEYGNSAWGSNLADLNVASGATFDIWDGNTQVDAVNGTGTIRKGWVNANSLTLGVDNGSGSFNGTINSVGGGGFSLIKAGTGTQTLSGSIGHNGGTTVNGGRLVLKDTLTGSSNFVTNAELEFEVTTGTQTLSGGTISGTGSLVKSGAGALLLGSAGPTAQTVALTGAASVIEVKGGTLRNEYGNTAWSGNQAGLIVAGGATFDVWDGSATVDEVNGSGIISKGWAGASTLTIGVNGGSGNFSGSITNGVGGMVLAKQGAGTQILSGSSTYTGATSVSAGTLLVNGLLGASSVTVNGGAFGGSGTVGGGLTLDLGTMFHVVDLFDALQVAGTVNLFAGFGVDDLSGLNWGSVADGTYTLVDGNLGAGVFAALANNSLASAHDLGGGRYAYFQEGSLQLVIIPEPSATFLLMLGSSCLALRRRRFIETITQTTPVNH